MYFVVSNINKQLLLGYWCEHFIISVWGKCVQYKFKLLFLLPFSLQKWSHTIVTYFKYPTINKSNKMNININKGKLICDTLTVFYYELNLCVLEQKWNIGFDIVTLQTKNFWNQSWNKTDIIYYCRWSQKLHKMCIFFMKCSFLLFVVICTSLKQALLNNLFL